MKKYSQMTKDELTSEKLALEAEYKKVQELGLDLNMARGKPSIEQLDLNRGIFEALGKDDDMVSSSGNDTRNYGELTGIKEARELLAGMMGTTEAHVIALGNSSLNIMFDQISRGYTFGYLGNTPWCKLDKVKWICPVPGYDRHFAITELFGIEMINVDMKADGPDMDEVERLVSSDDSIKGIWCIPKYQNPTGAVFSDKTVKRFANLKPAAKDFRIFWDNAYCVHHLYDEGEEILDIISECEKAGNPDMVFEFASTSKVSIAGGGISGVASSKANLDDMKKVLTIQTIGADKVNMLRHVRFYKNMDGIKECMKAQASLLRPRFELVLDSLAKEIEPLGLGTWLSPKGGYFVTFTSLDGCAKRIVSLCKEAGVVLTGAGAPFPYGKDPHDAVIRIAPSYPTMEELAKACSVFVLCVKLASVEKFLAD